MGEVGHKRLYGPVGESCRFVGVDAALRQDCFLFIDAYVVVEVRGVRAASSHFSHSGGTLSSGGGSIYDNFSLFNASDFKDKEVQVIMYEWSMHVQLPGFNGSNGSGIEAEGGKGTECGQKSLRWASV